MVSRSGHDVTLSNTLTKGGIKQVVGYNATESNNKEKAR